MKENPKEKKIRDYWRCFGLREHNCKARLITEGLHILKYKGEHNHMPPERTRYARRNSQIIDRSDTFNLHNYE